MPVASRVVTSPTDAAQLTRHVFRVLPHLGAKALAEDDCVEERAEVVRALPQHFDETCN